MAFKGFSLCRSVQPVKIAAPYAFAFGALGLQIFLRVRFKGIAAGFIAEPITVPLEVGDQACIAWVNLHATHGIHMGPVGGCCFFQDYHLFLFRSAFLYARDMPLCGIKT